MLAKSMQQIKENISAHLLRDMLIPSHEVEVDFGDDHAD
jgi:hypothetical protein